MAASLHTMVYEDCDVVILPQMAALSYKLGFSSLLTKTVVSFNQSKKCKYKMKSANYSRVLLLGPKFEGYIKFTSSLQCSFEFFNSQ